MNLGQFMIKNPIKFSAFVVGGAVLIANLAEQGTPPPKPANPWALASPAPAPVAERGAVARLREVTGEAMATVERDLHLAPAAAPQETTPPASAPTNTPSQRVDLSAH